MIDPYDLAKADALLTGYHLRWKDEPIEVLAVEASFEVDLINPATGKPSQTYRLGGKVDAVVRLPDGRVAVFEHKSSSEDIGGGTDYWRRLRIDSQVSNYLGAAHSLGFDTADVCIYDVIKKPGLRPKRATPVESRRYTKAGKLDARQREIDESPEEFRTRILDEIGEKGPDNYYQRGEVVRLAAERDEAAYDLWQTARAMREAELAHRYPRNPDSCIRYGRACAYFDVCSGVATLDDATRYRAKPSKHEELPDAKRRLPIISTSEVRCFHRCPREWHFAYQLRVRPAQRSEALRFGSLLHLGLEAWWRTVDIDAAREAMRTARLDEDEIAEEKAA